MTSPAKPYEYFTHDELDELYQGPTPSPSLNLRRGYSVLVVAAVIREDKADILFMSQEVNDVGKVLEMVVQPHTTLDIRIGRKSSTICHEDELSYKAISAP